MGCGESKIKQINITQEVRLFLEYGWFGAAYFRIRDLLAYCHQEYKVVVLKMSQNFKNSFTALLLKV